MKKIDGFELLAPEGYRLPPFLIKKRSSRINIENDNKVKIFINTKLLLNEEFRNLYLNVLTHSKEIYKLSEVYEDYSQIVSNQLCGILPEVKDNKITVKNNKEVTYSKELADYFTKILEEVLKKANPEEKGKFYRTYFEKNKQILLFLNDVIENEISNYERNFKVSLDILTSIDYYFCKKCCNILSIDKFNPTKCICGEEITKRSEVDKISISLFNKHLVNFIENNYWLEFGIDYILKQKKLISKVGYDILGNSGECHEIDIIVYWTKKDYRFFCECKSSALTTNDIFIFSGKMSDIGINKGCIFTTSSGIQKGIIRLARSKNIDIVSDVLNKSSEEIFNSIKEI
jgi:hypothetical protein